MLRKSLLAAAALSAAAMAFPAVGNYVGGWMRYSWHNVEAATPVEVQISRAEALIDDRAAKKADLVVRASALERQTASIRSRIEGRKSNIEAMAEQVSGMAALLASPQAEYVMVSEAGRKEVLTFSALKARKVAMEAKVALATRSREADLAQLASHEAMAAEVTAKLSSFDKDVEAARDELTRLREKALDANVDARTREVLHAIDGVSGSDEPIASSFEKIRQGIERLDAGGDAGVSTGRSEGFAFDDPAASQPGDKAPVAGNR